MNDTVGFRTTCDIMACSAFGFAVIYFIVIILPEICEKKKFITITNLKLNVKSDVKISKRIELKTTTDEEKEYNETDKELFTDQNIFIL